MIQYDQKSLVYFEDELRRTQLLYDFLNQFLNQVDFKTVDGAKCLAELHQIAKALNNLHALHQELINLHRLHDPLSDQSLFTFKHRYE